MIPLLDPTNEEIEAFYRQVMLHASMDLRTRAQEMQLHASTHSVVSKVIVESIIGGKQFIAMIWDARTLGTHGMPCKQLVISRYDTTGTPRPKKTDGMLSSCLTVDELKNANLAAMEFSTWLNDNKPVNTLDAIGKFQEIGARYQSTDTDVVFIWTLEHARACLTWLDKEGK